MTSPDPAANRLSPGAPHDPLGAWSLSEHDFPRAAPLADKMRFLLRYAILAPSSHNTQPWLFRVGERNVELYADPNRSLSIADPDHRELYISCGAALLNLQMAMRHFGYEDRVEILPDEDNLELVARVTPGDTPRDAGEAHVDFNAIVKRHTNRASFETKPVPGALLSACTAAAHEHGAWFHLVEGNDERAALAALVEQADRTQMASDEYREELASWLHSNLSTVDDGMPGYAFGIGDLKSAVTPVVVRNLDTGENQAARDGALLARSPVIAVLGTDEDDLGDWVHAGQALESILLRAQAEGVSSSFLNQAVQVPALRRRLGSDLGLGKYPQFVIRMGYGPTAKPTPRRALTEFLLD